MARAKKAAENPGTTLATTKPKRGGGKAMTTKSMDEQLEALATDQVAKTREDGGSYIGTKNKEFRYKGGSLGSSMEVVILASTFENAYYDTPYDEDNPSSPACYAVSDSEDELVPAEDAPNKQADTCAECPMNVFGSDARGKGKACANRRRLALLAAGDLEGQIAFLRLAPTSLRNYDNYVRGVFTKFKKPTLAAVTELSMDPAVQHPVVKFRMEDIMPMDQIAIALERRLEATDQLHAGYDPKNYTGGSQSKRGGGRTGGKVKRKTGSKFSR